MTNSMIGRRIAFPPRLNERNQLGLVADDLAIRQAIYVIIFTAPGERVMRPDFGCRIHELLFDPANHQTAFVAERYVKEAILRWEPRINLQSVTVSFGDYEVGELFIHIHYEIKGQNDPRNLVFPYYLVPKTEG